MPGSWDTEKSSKQKRRGVRLLSPLYLLSWTRSLLYSVFPADAQKKDARHGWRSGGKKHNNAQRTSVFCNSAEFIPLLNSGLTGGWV
jgi:hypothetical protein